MHKHVVYRKDLLIWALNICWRFCFDCMLA